jgi:hypothetical protein
MKTATQADWKTEVLPQERISIRLDRTFSPQEMSSVRRELIPEQIEDKWFIFCKGNARPTP